LILMTEGLPEGVTIIHMPTNSPPPDFPTTAMDFLQ
jgi:hypothetical protein